MSSGDSGEMDRDRRDLARGARQILSGFGVRILARILLIAFVAKLFGASVFGRLGETVAIIELAAAFASFGLTKTMLGEFARDQATGRSIATRFVECLILTGAISIVIAGLLWAAWPTIFPTDAAPRLAVIGVPLIALADVALTATRHFRSVAWDTAVKTVIKPWSFLFFALIAYALVSDDFEWVRLDIAMPHMLIGAYLASLLISAVVAFFVTRNIYGGAVDRPRSIKQIAGVARRSFPIALNETGVFAFRRIDIILLGLVAGPAATGVYYLAQQIGTVVEKVRYLFEPMLAPIVAQSGSLEVIGAHLKRLCLFVFTVQLGLLIFASFNGDDLLRWFGPGFAAGLGVLIFILLGELFDGSFGLSELPLVFRHPHWPPRVVLLTLIVECVLVWTLARSFGAMGAAAGFAASMLALALMRLFLVSRHYNFKILNSTYIVITLLGLLSALPVFAAVRFAPDTPFTIVAANLIFILLYGAISFMILRKKKPLPLAEPTVPPIKPMAKAK